MSNEQSRSEPAEASGGRPLRPGYPPAESLATRASGGEAPQEDGSTGLDRPMFMPPVTGNDGPRPTEIEPIALPKSPVQLAPPRAPWITFLVFACLAVGALFGAWLAWGAR